jgi:hypothetical protein
MNRDKPAAVITCDALLSNEKNRTMEYKEYPPSVGKFGRMDLRLE